MPQTNPATALQKLSSQDAHSLQGDALFVDEATATTESINSPLVSRIRELQQDDFWRPKPKLKALPGNRDALRSSDTTQLS